MEPADIITQLHRRGISLRVIGEKLRAEPAEALTAELRELIRQHKADLVALLGAGEAVQTDPVEFSLKNEQTPEADIVIGLPCGRCGGRPYAPAPDGFTWPDGSKGDGWRCLGCGVVFLLSGAGMESQQRGPKLSALFRQLPAGHFVKTQED